MFARAYNFYLDFKIFLEDVNESNASKRYIVKMNGTRVAYIQTGQEYPAYQYHDGDMYYKDGTNNQSIEDWLVNAGFVIVKQVVSVHGGTPTRESNQ